MKANYLVVVLVILGSWVTLIAAANLIGRFVTTKEYACKNIAYQIELGKLQQTNDIEALYLEKRSNGFQKSTLQLILGISILVFGIILHLKNQQKVIGSRRVIIALFVNASYWLLFIYGIGYMVSRNWVYINSCVIDWIYIFLVAATIGFYGGYYLLQGKSIKQLIRTRFIGLIFIISIIGGLCSYFPITLGSAFSTNNYLPLFSIPNILTVGFFCFISFIHVFLGYVAKAYIPKMQA